MKTIQDAPARTKTYLPSINSKTAASRNVNQPDSFHPGYALNLILGTVTYSLIQAIRQLKQITYLSVFSNAQSAHQKIRKSKLTLSAGLLLTSMISASVNAEISFDGFTRFIFEGGDSQMPVILVNQSNEPALVQVTLDWGESQEKRELPMALSKPLLLILGNSKASVDVFYEGLGLPTDRESLFLLKALNVPKQSREENSVPIAVQHNLKLFYRPKLPSPTVEVAKNLRWSPSGKATYLARNDSPYYLTLTQVGLIAPSGAACGKTVDHLMIAPFSTYELTVTTCNQPVREVSYSFISDGGLAHPCRIPLL